MMTHDATCTCCSSQRRGIARRDLLAGGAALALAATADAHGAVAAMGEDIDLAPLAEPSSLFDTSEAARATLALPVAPRGSHDAGPHPFGVWPSQETQWLDYRWAEPVTTARVELYWWHDGRGIALPAAARLLRWDGTRFVPVPAAIGVAADRYNVATFAPVTTDRLRLEVDPQQGKSIGVLRWRVVAAGPVAMAPRVVAGIDRSVVLGGRTYLAGSAAWGRRRPGDTLRWTKESGPGEVIFADAAAPVTMASVSRAGDYVLRLEGSGAGKRSHATLRLRAEAPPPPRRLDVVYTTGYAVDGSLWQARVKALVTQWVPHCIDYCERTDLPVGDGGLDNFVEAGKALRGQPHGKHRGYVFSNAWVHQTVESMCIALMVDPAGDAEMIAAQATMRATLDRWIPVILAAQHPDGYLQTAYTLADRKDWPARWSPAQRANHEGYVAGYFIESAINHHTMTAGRDLRLYDAAKRLADCWVANIGPGRKTWFDGHQEMEQALVRFGRFVNDVEGGGRGDAYVRLARFLIDSREGGSEYDQSHLPAVKQYEAVGHAVRAMYFYSGMADIAAETGDRDYQSATLSLWDNMVNRKYYVTGGVGSGDTSEGFGVNYALRNDAYCESCSSCGLIFFQYKLNLAYHDAKYADLYEETMYNALLGATALDGRSFCYTNPLVNTERARWHSCPCCVGNISRTLMMLPTWTYVRAPDGVFVNLFVGGRSAVGEIAGVPVEIVQKTDYPWSGAVAITVNPARAARFKLRVRVPNRTTSALYTATPAVAGLTRLTVNGTAHATVIERGYAVIEREWHPSDRVEIELPMQVQRVVADERIDAARGQVALRYGPLVYNVETADGQDIARSLRADTPLKPVWRPDLLGGVMTIEGRWDDGSRLVAIPNFARMNRLGHLPREFPTSDGSVDYNPGGIGAGNVARTDGDAKPDEGLRSKVWIAQAPTIA